MTTQNASDDVTTLEVNGSSDEQKEAPEFESIEAALAEVTRLREINKEYVDGRDKVKAQLRKREEAVMKEQGKYKELYEAAQADKEQIVAKLKHTAVDTALEKALQAAGADVKIAMKLVDRNTVAVDENYTVDDKSIEALIKDMKDQYATIFSSQPKTVIPPVPKRVAETVVKGGYEEELMSLRKNPKATPAMLMALRAKYGR